MDLHDNVHPVAAISPGAATIDNTAWVSALVDRSGYDTVEFLIQTGHVFGRTGSTYAVTLTAGNASNGSDQAAVTDPTLLLGSLPSFAGTNDDTCYKLGYIGNCRYLQLTITPSGNTGGSGSSYVSAMCLLGSPRNAPV